MERFVEIWNSLGKELKIAALALVAILLVVILSSRINSNVINGGSNSVQNSGENSRITITNSPEPKP